MLHLKLERGRTSLPFLTLKALANFSPGLRFGNPGIKSRKLISIATLKPLRDDLPTLQSLIS